MIETTAFKEQFIIKIDEVSIDSGQYLPIEFGKCHRLHGHTYLIRNLVVVTKGIVNFNKFKEVYAQFDHYIIAPEKDKGFWQFIQKSAEIWTVTNKIAAPCTFECLFIPYEMSAVEYIAKYLKEKLKQITGVLDVAFELYETPNSSAMEGLEDESH